MGKQLHERKAVGVIIHLGPNFNGGLVCVESSFSPH